MTTVTQPATDWACISLQSCVTPRPMPSPPLHVAFWYFGHHTGNSLIFWCRTASRGRGQLGLFAAPPCLGKANLLSPQGFPSSDRPGPWYFSNLLVFAMGNPGQRPPNEAFSKPILLAPLDYWLLTAQNFMFLISSNPPKSPVK